VGREIKGRYRLAEIDQALQRLNSLPADWFENKRNGNDAD
jgi:hypothetical protein